MSPTTPSFVRLSDHMVGGCVVDMDSGWSLSGYDVQPYPDDREQAKFVRRKINAGAIEPASQAEYDEAHPADEEDEDAKSAASFVDAVKAASGGGSSKQEHLLRQREMGRHENILRTRQVETLRSQGVEVDDDASLEDAEYAEEEARLQALAQEQDDADLGTDDPEEQQDRTATRAPAGAKKAAKKTASARKRS